MRSSKAALKECCVWARKAGKTPFNEFQMLNSNRLTGAIWWILDQYNGNRLRNGYRKYMADRVETSDAADLADDYMKAINKAV